MKTQSLFAALLLSVLSLACAGAKTAAEKPEAQASGAPPVAETWRATPPQASGELALRMPKFEKATLENGLSVYVSSVKDLPLLSINVAFAAGSAEDPLPGFGTANLAYAMLLEGAGVKDAVAIDGALADLGASASVTVKADGSRVGLTVLKKHADAATALLAEIVQKPRFAPADFENKKKETLADLALQAGNPRFLAQEAFGGAVFGANHPYGHVSSGTPKTVTGLKAASVKSWYFQHTGPKAAAVVITGDATLEEAVALSKKYFSDWKSNATVPPAPKDVAASKRTDVLLVPKPGLNQTVVLLGRPAVRAGAEDEVSLWLANTVFGGTFASRLNMNLREAKGYSYGAFAQMDARRGVGPLLAGSSVRADVTGPSVEEVMHEVNDITAKPITQTELDAARDGNLKSLPGSFDTIGGLATVASELYFKALPLDRLEQLAKKLEATTLAETHAAAKKYFEADKLRLILVGDPVLVRQQVEPLKLGKIKEHLPPGMPEVPQAKARPAASIDTPATQ